VFRLVFDPVLVPTFGVVFLLQRGQTLAVEEFGQALDGGLREIGRRSRARRTGREGDGIDRAVADEDGSATRTRDARGFNQADSRERSEGLMNDCIRVDS
jgi:hypothetical protein